MPGHPTPHRHANRADLAAADPHTRVAVDTTARDAKVRQRVDHHLLKPAQPRMQVTLAFWQVHDGIHNDLAGAVPGGFAAALNLNDRHVHARGIPVRRLAAERDHIVVLGREQHIADAAFRAQHQQLLLQAMRVLVPRASQHAHLQRRRGGAHFFW